jgi:chemotaxis protein histidine kinase CheA
VEKDMTEILGKRNKAAGLSDKVSKKVKSKVAAEPPKIAEQEFYEEEVAQPIISKKKEKLKNLPEETPKQKKKNAKVVEEEVVEEEPQEEEEEAEEGQTKGPGKKVHLKPDQIEQRIKELQEKIDGLTGPENASKRKRAYQRLIQLKKASSNPEEFAVDPEEELKKAAEDKQRRIQKKLDKARRQKKANTKTQRHKHDWCIICKTQGHISADCRQGKAEPELVEELNKNVCFNCGGNDHGLYQCPKQRGNTLAFATCFYCKEKGHISRDCPQNEHGIYHKGGSCFECGSKRHLAKECPYRLGNVGGATITNEGYQGRNSNYNNQDEGQNYQENQADENDIFSDGDA